MVSLHYIFILVIIHCNLISPMKIPQDSLDKYVKKNDGLLHRLFKRQNKCLEDEYIADNHCCKNCNAGSIVVSDCTEPGKNPECKECTEGVDYMDKPSGYHQCQRCLPCESSLGLEMLYRCTKSMNTICQCMKEFVCSDSSPSPDGGCNKCVHHSITEDGGVSSGTIIASVLGTIIVLVIIGVAIYYWKRKKRENNGSPGKSGQGTFTPVPNNPDDPPPLPETIYYWKRKKRENNGSPGKSGQGTFTPVPNNPDDPPPLPENIDLEKHLHEFAGVMEIGTVMKLATKTLPYVDIEDNKKDYPNDAREQKHQLLRKWYNAYGRKGALETLLRACPKKEADEIQKLILT